MSVEVRYKWFYGVDSLRIVLAIIVMLSHFEDPYANALKSSATFLPRNLGFFLANAFDGTSAVIAFFIISGFVIHYPNKDGIKDLKEFWVRRLIRIFVPLSIILVIGSYYGHPEQTVVWSIFCELIYYGIYPFLSLINLSWKKKFFISYVVAAIFILVFSYHDVLAVIKQTNNNYHGYYWQLGSWLTWIVGLPCWLLGVLIAENIDTVSGKSFANLLKYRIAVFVISCFCCIAKFHLHLSYIISMNFFALLLSKWIQTEIAYYKNHQPFNILERMGKFSYSLYLCHPLIYLTLGLLISKTLFTYPLFIVLTISFSYLFYLAIERPSHQLARRLNNRLKLSRG